MTRRLIVSVLGSACLAIASNTFASPDKPLQLHVYGGFSPVAGDASTYVNDGWGLDFGGVWSPNPQGALGVRFDLGYDWWDVNTGAIPTGELRVDDGDANNWSLRAGLQFTSTNAGRTHVTAGLGLGGYSVHGHLSQTALVPGYVCDPYWGWCYWGVVEGEAIVASKTTTKLGYYGNLGVTFDTSETSELFLEAQYHYVPLSNTLEYWPVVLGYRW